MSDTDSKIIEKLKLLLHKLAPVQNAPATPAAPATK